MSFSLFHDKKIMEPLHIGSYDLNDVVFLLKDIGDVVIEKDTKDREKNIQSGIHYSEMLPIEYKPQKEYHDLFIEAIRRTKKRIAYAVAVVSELILKKKGKNVVLVSLARAGTPAGILIKRYLEQKFDLYLKHFSISIIRGKGFDENAIIYLLRNFDYKDIQFIDGWTGKGAISNELKEACNNFYEKYNIRLDNDLAVIADPGFCTNTYGTREDFLIPSACLNSTVSGLISRTILNKEYLNEDDFHGVKVYNELRDEDDSYNFINSIVNEFGNVNNIEEIVEKIYLDKLDENNYFLGLRDVKNIQEKYSIDDINLVKPGIGETTRVLLRRVPWRILINSNINENEEDLKHILNLARERNVKVEKFPLMSYKCCGIIKPLRRD